MISIKDRREQLLRCYKKASQEMKAVYSFHQLCLFAVCLSRMADLAAALSTTTSSSTRSSFWAPQHHPNLFPYLSVLIPAYNEEQRLGNTLKNYQEYLLSHPYWNPKYGQRCQIVVADDGSTDGTANLVRDFALQSTTIPIYCVTLSQNCGKGAALHHGIAHILSQQPTSWILTADADGSAPLSVLDPMIRRVEEWYSLSTTPSRNGTALCIDEKSSPLPLLVAGYRAYASTSPSRLVFRWGFRTVVRIIAGDLGVRDTQCGCKLLSPTAATLLYRDLHLPGWSHDVEVLYRARKKLGMIVLEAPVTWQDQDGSKLVASPGGVWAVSAQMFAQVVQLRWAYETGAWRFPDTPSIPSDDG